MSNKIFHSSAGSSNAGMYHSGVKSVKPMMVKKVLKKKVSSISSDGMALVPNRGAIMESAQKQRDARFVKDADKKLKGFKFGVGVGK